MKALSCVFIHHEKERDQRCLRFGPKKLSTVFDFCINQGNASCETALFQVHTPSCPNKISVNVNRLYPPLPSTTLFKTYGIIIKILVSDKDRGFIIWKWDLYYYFKVVKSCKIIATFTSKMQSCNNIFIMSWYFKLPEIYKLWGLFADFILRNITVNKTISLIKYLNFWYELLFTFLDFFQLNLRYIKIREPKGI